jgi:hypothetical protein
MNTTSPRAILLSSLLLSSVLPACAPGDEPIGEDTSASLPSVMSGNGIFPLARSSTWYPEFRTLAGNAASYLDWTASVVAGGPVPLDASSQRHEYIPATPGTLASASLVSSEYDYSTVDVTNGLAPAGARDWYSQNGKTASLFEHLVAIALPGSQGARMTLADHNVTGFGPFTWPAGGSLSLGGSWASGAFTGQGQRERVSGAFAALTNQYGFTVQVSLRSPGYLAPGDLTTLPMIEGAYYGDMFANPPVLYTCSGGHDAAAAQLGRECVAGGCPGVIVPAGRCDDVCVETYTGDAAGSPSFTASAPGGTSNRWGFSGCKDPGGKTWSNVITVFIDPSGNSLPTSTFTPHPMTAQSTATCAEGVITGTVVQNQILAGIGISATGAVDAALCKAMRHSIFPAASAPPDRLVATQVAFSGGVVAATRSHGTFAWAGVGQTTFECAEDEYVYGIATSAGQIAGVACKVGNLSRHYCRSMPGGTRGTPISGEWDAGSTKTECALNEYVAGLSFAGQTSAPTGLLCCAQ